MGTNIELSIAIFNSAGELRVLHAPPLLTLLYLPNSALEID